MTTVVTPISGAEIDEVPDTSLDALDDILRRATAASVPWARTDPERRGAILVDVARRMRSRASEVSSLETLNTGKLPRDTAREADRAAACFEYYGGYADKVVGTVVPMGEGMHVYTEREPYGVVAGIIPWNVPYFFAAKKIAPAIAFGNVVVLKPAAETPLTALLLGQIVREVLAEYGAPEDVVQVVTGGAGVGAALVSDRRTKLVVFTGSDRAGAVVGSTAAAHYAPATLELGGKSPQVVFADADLDAAAAGVVQGVMGACGQMCIAGSRLMVERPVYDELLDRVNHAVSGLVVGDPREAATEVGPQVTRVQADKTLAMVAEAQRAGAVVTAQARRPEQEALRDGFWVAPTVLADLPKGAAIRDQEVFGPVLNVEAFETEAEAIELANDTRFGLAAGVWTADLGRAHRVASRVRAGTIWLNTYRILSDKVPFGGVGASGFGREGGTDAAATYTWTKSVWASWAPGLPTAYRGQ